MCLGRGGFSPRGNIPKGEFLGGREISGRHFSGKNFPEVVNFSSRKTLLEENFPGCSFPRGNFPGKNFAWRAGIFQEPCSDQMSHMRS